MGLKERREREKESLRGEILEAARELFVAEGYENVSMRRIAERIEYSPTTIYLYFKDKSELLNRICEETFTKLAARLERIHRAKDDPLTALRRGCLTYIDFGLKHPNHYRLVFMDGGLPADEESDAAALSAGRRAFDHLRDGVRGCVEAGLFRDVEVEAASQALWAAQHGITSLLIAKPDFPWVNRQQLVELTVDAMLAGFRR